MKFLREIAKQALSSKLLRATSVFFIATIIAQALPFVLLPVLTRFLSPEDYGIVAMFGVMAGLVVPFIGLNARAAINRQYFRRDEIDMAEYVFNCLLLAVVGLVLCVVVFGLAGSWIAEQASFPAEWMWAILAYASFHFLTQVRLSLWQIQSKPVPYGTFQVLLTGGELALALLLIVGLGFTWDGRILSRVVAMGGFGVLSVVLLIRGGWIRPRFNREYFRHAVRYGLPLVPHSIGMWVLTAMDRWFVTAIVGLDETGIYSVGAQIAAIAGFVSGAFTTAWAPWFYERLTEGDEASLIQVCRATLVSVAVLLALAVGLGLIAAPLLGVLVGEQFVAASRYVIWLALGVAVYGIYRLGAGYLFYAERTRSLAVITATAGLVNLVGNYVLVTAYGGLGAAIASLFAYGVMCAAVWVLAMKTQPMPWRKALQWRSE